MGKMNKKYIRPGVLLLVLLLQFSFDCFAQEEKQASLKLWYETPASVWEEALPLGNGRLGVMVFGSTSRERIQLNDDSMWPGDLGWDQPEGKEEDIRQIRELLFAGKNKEADQLMVEKFSNKGVTRSHQTMGELFIDLDHSNITEYRRELDLRTAVSTVSYRTNGELITEKVFVSFPHKAIIIKISSEAKEGLNGKVQLTRPKDHGVPTVDVYTSEEGLLLMEGMVTQRGGQFRSEKAPILEGVRFETLLNIEHVGGEIVHGKGFLTLKNVHKATLVLVSNSSWYQEDYKAQNKKDLEAVAGVDPEILEQEHILDYQNLFSRVELILGDQNLDQIPTDKRLERMMNDSVDLGMEALLFHYGRYLLIGSSRVGTNPANLQGVWNEHIEAPWNADYHLNINLQMNYWPANMTGLDDLNLPLFDYLDRLVESGKETALKNFGCEGAFLPHATDLWAPTWMRGATAYWGSSMGAGGWMVQHYWQHFAFTQDTTFLKSRAFPAIREVAKFYSDWVIEDPRDGKLVSAPSTSPENRYLNDKGEAVSLCMGSAMDQQVMEEVFDNYLEASAILGVSDHFTEKVKLQRAQLRPGFVLGSDGRILEWDREYAEREPGHRHMSHLYGFHPGTQVSKDQTPEIFEAVRKTLDYRLANGGAGTGWSRAWLINCSARLLDGEMAHDHIQLLFKKSMYNNLFDGHPPFQIDGNFGYTAGLSEMLLQSHLRDKNGDYYQDILPALPSAYTRGKVSGLKGRGAFEVSMEWNDGDLVSMEIKSLKGNPLNVRYRGSSISTATLKGESYFFTSEDFKLKRH
jgi:alpha-L-fucosidase 2